MPSCRPQESEPWPPPLPWTGSPGASLSHVMKRVMDIGTATEQVSPDKRCETWHEPAPHVDCSSEALLDGRRASSLERLLFAARIC